MAKVKVKKGDIEVEIEEDGTGAQELLEMAWALIQVIIRSDRDEGGGPPD